MESENIEFDQMRNNFFKDKPNVGEEDKTPQVVRQAINILFSNDGDIKKSSSNPVISGYIKNIIGMQNSLNETNRFSSQQTILHLLLRIFVAKYFIGYSISQNEYDLINEYINSDVPLGFPGDFFRSNIYTLVAIDIIKNGNSETASAKKYVEGIVAMFPEMISAQTKELENATKVNAEAISSWKKSLDGHKEFAEKLL